MRNRTLHYLLKLLLPNVKKVDKKQKYPLGFEYIDKYGMTHIYCKKVKNENK